MKDPGVGFVFPPYLTTPTGCTMARRTRMVMLKEPTRAALAYARQSARPLVKLYGNLS
jgi:hypothetical protein